jgi:hypothetical protein
MVRCLGNCLRGRGCFIDVSWRERLRRVRRAGSAGTASIKTLASEGEASEMGWGMIEEMRARFMGYSGVDIARMGVEWI